MKLEEIERLFDEECDGPMDRARWDAVHVRFLGRSGLLTEATKALKQLSPAEKPLFGKQLNLLKKKIEDHLAAEKGKWEAADTATFRLDTTLPGRSRFVGHVHPITSTLTEISNIFVSLGFTIEDGPEVELDYYNFEAVNIPKDHPARDMQDTFFVSDRVVLRTHTSPVQARVMEKRQPPIRMICPGRVYRKDTPDATHMPFFHQVEGLVVDERTTFSDLKGTLATFVRRMFGREIRTRFRPSFFSFTEPSAEVDMICIFCKGKGCRVCKQTGWIEIMGAGMVHPNLFRHAGYPEGRYTGYAFGMGADRIAMLRYDVNDLRVFFENDVRFLSQFS